MPHAAGEPLLTVIVPVYNEAATVGELLRRLIAAPFPDKQIVIVDDGSGDGTAGVVDQFRDHANVVIARHPVNRGKGAAVRTGLPLATGRFTVIQDADLEYDPNDLPAIVAPLAAGTADAVYGSRYLAPATRLPWSRFRLAVVILNGWVRVLYRRRLTDEATCYKAMPTKLFHRLALTSDRFEICPEITAKLCRGGHRLVEVPISYQPRASHDGKKIGWRDAVWAFWALLKWRFKSMPRSGAAAADPSA